MTPENPTRPARRLTCVAAVALLCLTAAGARAAAPPHELIRKGNQQFAAGKFAEALEAYDQVDESDARVAAELLYDRAAAHFKLGQLDEARELWVRAAGLRDARFEARCRYGLGNCDYAAALQALNDKDAQHALESLGRAIEQYEDALRLDPQRTDARANLELAAQLKRQIEQQVRKQPQSQPSQGNQQQENDKNRQDQPKKQPQSQPSQKSSRPDQDKQSCPNPDERKQQDKSQQSENDRPDQPQQRPDQDSSESNGDQRKKQKADAKKGAAAGKDRQRQDVSAGKVPIRISKEEAQRLLQKIRDAEQRRRAMLRAREAARQKPVEKDW